MTNGTETPPIVHLESHLDLYKEQTSWESGMDDWTMARRHGFCDVWYRVRLLWSVQATKVEFAGPKATEEPVRGAQSSNFSPLTSPFSAFEHPFGFAFNL